MLNASLIICGAIACFGLGMIFTIWMVGDVTPRR